MQSSASPFFLLVSVVALVSMLVPGSPVVAQSTEPVAEEDQKAEESTPIPRPTALVVDNDQLVRTPVPRPAVVDVAPPPPQKPRVLITADRDCLLKLDGEEIGELGRNEVLEIEATPGEHLLQAFARETPDVVWSGVLSVPDSGRAVAAVELNESLEEWREVRFSLQDGVVEDRKTGLEWAQDAVELSSFPAATAACRALPSSRTAPWRMPTVEELSTLYHPDHPEPRYAGSRPDRFNPVEVVPILIQPAFEHNNAGQLWATSMVNGQKSRAMHCSFFGELDCQPEKARRRAATLCVRSAS